jgi:phosphohistidine phosphatase
MRLFLVRHGIAVDHLGGGITRDSERTLTEEGTVEMKQVAKALTKINNKKPDLILSSPLVRARQTAEIIAEAYNMEVTLTDSLAPAGSQSVIFKAINRHPGVNQVYLVGHEPDIGMLANKLLWAGVECELPFKKGAVMRIDVADMPPTMPGVLKWYMPPKLVHSLFS